MNKLACRYLGGHPRVTREEDGQLHFNNRNLRFEPQRGRGFKIALRDIQGVEVEASGQIDRRVTATRAIGLGLLAWAVKKREDTTANFLSIEFGTGNGTGRVTFQADTLPELSQRIGPRAKGRQQARGFAAALSTAAAKAAAKGSSITTPLTPAARKQPTETEILPAGRVPCPACGRRILPTANRCRWCDSSIRGS